MIPFKEFRKKHPEITDEEKAKDAYWQEAKEEFAPILNKFFKYTLQDAQFYVWTKFMDQQDSFRKGYQILLRYEVIVITKVENSINIVRKNAAHALIHKFIPNVLPKEGYEEITSQEFGEARNLYLMTSEFYNENTPLTYDF